MILHLEHHDPWGRIVPGAAILRMIEGKRKGRMHALSGLQPRRKIVANNDVKLGGDLLECHVNDPNRPQNRCQVRPSGVLSGFELIWGYRHFFKYTVFAYSAVMALCEGCGEPTQKGIGGDCRQLWTSGDDGGGNNRASFESSRRSKFTVKQSAPANPYDVKTEATRASIFNDRRNRG